MRRLFAMVVAALALLLAAAPAGAATIHHVFIIVLENESAATTFGPSSPAPYLSKTLTAQGAYLPNYYGIGHNSNDNYIAMISGQAPNAETQADCQQFVNVAPGTIGSDGQAMGEGCVYPATVPTIASQLTGAGFTWRDYNEDMGNTPSRESSVCGHPAVGAVDGTQTATAADQYATRHNPFVYFHGIIDDTTLCDTHVVNLDALPQDLASASATANYTFITPNLCDDGHDAPCQNGQPGGLTSADTFLRTWVPRITASPAYRQDGLLIVAFDEAATSDTTSCCGELPGPGSPAPGETGPGGGVTGAVLLSPCIAPGTVSRTPYNHYSMLGSVENLFGLPHLGEAALSGQSYFGSDVFTGSCAAGGGGGGGGGSGGARVSVHVPALASQAAATPRVRVRWSGLAGSRYDVQVRARGAWRPVASGTRARSLVFRGARGRTYAFRVRPTGTTAWSAIATCVVPSGVRPAGGHYSRGGCAVSRAEAWLNRAIQSSRRGATFTLRYRGGALSLIGERTARGGVLSVTIDGRRRTLRLHAARLHRRRTLGRYRLKPGRHRVTVRVVRGLIALEGYGIANRTG